MLVVLCLLEFVCLFCCLCLRFVIEVRACRLFAMLFVFEVCG